MRKPLRASARIIPLTVRGVGLDPVLHQTLHLMAVSGKSLKWISERSGVSLTTLSNWRKGKTRRPQNATLDFVLRVLGYERKLTRRL